MKGNDYIIIGGDFATQHRGEEAIKSGSAFSPEFVRLFKEAKDVIINLESPVAGAEAVPIPKLGPAIKCSTDAIDYLKESGVTAVTLANNHLYDYGQKGVESTIDVLEKKSIGHVGAGDAVTRQKPLILSHSNIAIINCCESEFSVDRAVGANKLDLVDISEQILRLIGEGYTVILIIHGGSEYFTLPSPRMKKLYRFFIDLGAKAVINHHQHRFSGYETYNNGYIFYGLGNLFFDRSAKSRKKTPISEWSEGYMVKLLLCEESGISGFELIPYRQCQEELVLRPATADEESIFNDKISRLNDIISDDRALETEYHKFMHSVNKDKLSQFSPYSGRILKALNRRGLLPSFLSRKKTSAILNMIMCESHRDLCIDAFKEKIGYNDN